MAIVGYARVSSRSQSLDVQLDLLRQAGCTKTFEEKFTGKTLEGREELKRALDYVREGDVLVVTRLDRLARSITDLRNLIDHLSEKDVGFQCLQQGTLDTTRSDGRLLLNILGAFAEFELDLRRERQADGIAKAKAAGVYKGRPPSVPTSEVRALVKQGVGATEIARRLKIGRASVYRVMGAASAAP